MSTLSLSSENNLMGGKKKNKSMKHIECNSCNLNDEVTNTVERDAPVQAREIVLNSGWIPTALTEAGFTR